MPIGPVNASAITRTLHHGAKQGIATGLGAALMDFISTGYVQAFLIGVVLYASNVAAIPEWIFISALWRGYHLLADGVVVNLTFALGAGLGTAGWFIFLVKFIAKRQRGFKPTTLSRINLGAGVALLIFSAYFGYEIIFGTNWHAVSGSFQANTGQQ
jgi:hypothetical protein